MKKVFQISILIASMLQVGCASVETISMKDGKVLYQSSCNRTTADCHKLASEKCNGSYDVVDESSYFGKRYVMFTCK